MIDSIHRGLCLLGLAILAPLRRGVVRAEHRLIRAEYRIRAKTSALFICLAIVLTGCAYRERRQTIARIEAGCVAEFGRATTDDQIDAIEARCHERVREVTDAE